MRLRLHAMKIVEVLLAAVALSSCVEDRAGVVTPQNAVVAPGLTGAWVAANGGGQAFIARTGALEYTVSTASNGILSKVHKGVHLTPLDADKHTYAVSLPAEAEEPNRPERLLFVLKLRTNSFEMRFPKDERLTAIAAEAGVSLDGRSLRPGASTGEVLKLLKAIAKPGFEGGYVYRRQGWFNLPETSYTLERAAALLAENKATEAAGVLAYLALRGSPAAQIRFASMGTTGTGVKKDPLMAAWYLLEAHRSGHPDAARMLATHLQHHGIDKPAVFQTPTHWFGVAAAQSDSPDARRALNSAAKRECAALMAAPDSRWKSLDDCAEAIGKLASFSAAVAIEREATEEEIAEAYVVKTRLMEKDKAIKREIEETKREIQKLEEEIRRR